MGLLETLEAAHLLEMATAAEVKTHVTETVVAVMETVVAVMETVVAVMETVVAVMEMETEEVHAPPERPAL